MRDKLITIALAAAAVSFGGTEAARSCTGGTTTTPGTFQYRLIDVRYDGADPAKNNGLATIAASLGTSGTPLYECVAQWPETWAGWYDAGSSIIWSDCIWTGAGFGQDTTVSFAVDWKNKTLYLSHTFLCSDHPGSSGIATGSVHLDVNCTSQDGAPYCFPTTTAAGTRPDLRISTSLGAGPDAAVACVDNSRRYQSWRLEKWFRQIEMAPGTASPGSDKPFASDTGPSFTLTSMSNNQTFRCSTEGNTSGVFDGKCNPADSVSGPAAIASASTTFRFDSKLNLLKISQHWDCNNATRFDVVGVSYMQASCDRNFNSVIFTCTIAAVWIGTGTT